MLISVRQVDIAKIESMIIEKQGFPALNILHSAIFRRNNRHACARAHTLIHRQAAVSGCPAMTLLPPSSQRQQAAWMTSTSISTIIFPSLASHPHFLLPLICLHLPVAKGGRAPAALVADGCSTTAAAAAAWDVFSTGANGLRSREATKVYAAVEELTTDQSEWFNPENFFSFFIFLSSCYLVGSISDAGYMLQLSSPHSPTHVPNGLLPKPRPSSTLRCKKIPHHYVAWRCFFLSQLAELAGSKYVCRHENLSRSHITFYNNAQKSSCVSLHVSVTDM